MERLVDFLLARIAEDRAALQLVDAQFPGSDRWVAECDSRRRIVELVAPQPAGNESLAGCDVLLLMAQPYGEHRDFRKEWNS
jgi:hypothetical protein